MPSYLNPQAAILAFIALPAIPLPATAFEGTYRNKQDTTLKVTKNSGGYYAAIAVASERCVGDFEGPATVKGNTMTLRSREAESHCVVKITFKGRSATLDEQGDCQMHHGAFCGFRGTVRR